MDRVGMGTQCREGAAANDIGGKNSKGKRRQNGTKQHDGIDYVLHRFPYSLTLSKIPVRASVCMYYDATIFAPTKWKTAR